MRETNLPGPILLYDGVCGFCNSTVQFILRHDTRGSIRFAALQGETARGILDRHPELQGIDSLILIEGCDTAFENLFIRSSGALRVAEYLGGWWKVFLIVKIIPVSWRDGAYDLFARYRYRFFGRYDSCPLPSAAVRSRFLE